MNLREWALPVYTVLVQIASGGLLVLWLLRFFSRRKAGQQEEIDRLSNTPLVVIFATIVVAMLGAHFHLSKPFFSFLAILNFKASWLSREVAFNLAFAILVWLLLYLHWFKDEKRRLTDIVGWAAVLFGFLTVFCMSRIYLLPTQATWSMPGTIAAFFTSTILLGAMAMAALLIMDLVFSEVRKQENTQVRLVVIGKSLTWLSAAAVSAMALTLGLYYFQITTLVGGDEAAQTSLRLLGELYQPLFGVRLGMLIVGVGWLVVSTYQVMKSIKRVQELLAPVYLSCLIVMIGEILGRFLFYASHVRVGI